MKLIKSLSQASIITTLSILLYSCKESVIAIGLLNKEEWGRALLAELMPSIFFVGTFYLVMYFFLKLDKAENSHINNNVKGFTFILSVIEIAGFFFSEVGAVLLALAELAAIVIVSHLYFKLSLGKSFGVLGICLSVGLLIALGIA